MSLVSAQGPRQLSEEPGPGPSFQPPRFLYIFETGGGWFFVCLLVYYLFFKGASRKIVRILRNLKKHVSLDKNSKVEWGRCREEGLPVRREKVKN